MGYITMLDGEIASELEELQKMELGTDSYKSTVDGITKLMDRSIELKRIETEEQQKDFDREVEAEFKAIQIKSEKRDSMIKNVLTFAGIVIPAALTVWGTVKSLKFEETGVFTSTVSKGFINKLLPKK